jgi:hypothetical protein
MHPQIARNLIAQRNRDVAAMAARRPALPRRASSHDLAARRLAPRRRLALPFPALPVWRVTWSRVAAPAGSDRSWLIVISARRARLGV